MLRLEGVVSDDTVLLIVPNQLGLYKVCDFELIKSYLGVHGILEVHLLRRNTCSGIKLRHRYEKELNLLKIGTSKNQKR